MIFRYYFFKDGDRSYDLADLLAFFQANPNISFIKEATERKFHYVNESLDFDCMFIISEKSIVRPSDIVNLDPRYLDLNIYVELPVLLADYKVLLIIDIIEELCKRFKFYVYNEVFEDVLPFRRSLMLKAFQKVKEAYKTKYEEEIVAYNKLDKKVIDSVYEYLENQTRLKMLNQEEGIIPLDYIFFKKEGTRRAYVGIRWDGTQPFIIPSNIDLLVYYNGTDRQIILFDEFYDKVRKLLKPVQSQIAGLSYITNKDMRKISKIMKKTKWSAINQNVDLEQVDLRHILDI